MTKLCPVANTRNPWAEAAARLREAYEDSGLTQTRLAVMAEIDPNTLSDMLSGKRNPRPESLRAVCRALGLNHIWVKTGIGERSIKQPHSSSNGAGRVDGIDLYLANRTGIALDEQQWLRRVSWPLPHVRYPDLVYDVFLQLYRSMRDYRPTESIRHADNSDPS